MDVRAPSTISLVLPTFNRADALRANLGTMLALEGVDEIVIVNDGSSDRTLDVCNEIDDSRVKVVSHPTNLGVARARSTGVEAASGYWILFGEDDCRFPNDYAVVLLAEAQRSGCDIVGAPMISCEGTDEGIAELAASLPRARTGPSLEQVNVFVAEPVETPFLCALSLIRRSVFEQVSFFEGYPVNGFREETDFFIQASRVGFRCRLTAGTYAYQLTRWHGGQHNSHLARYEYWLIRNNWRFLLRHGRWMVDQGYIRGLASAQLRFLLLRFRDLGGGFVRARLGRARSALARRSAPV
jgi:GT2 family glycosyltransferase